MATKPSIRRERNENESVHTTEINSMCDMLFGNVFVAIFLDIENSISRCFLPIFFFALFGLVCLSRFFFFFVTLFRSRSCPHSFLPSLFFQNVLKNIQTHTAYVYARTDISLERLFRTCVCVCVEDRMRQRQAKADTVNGWQRARPKRTTYSKIFFFLSP